MDGLYRYLDKMVKARVTPNEGSLMAVAKCVPGGDGVDGAQKVFDELTEKWFPTPVEVRTTGQLSEVDLFDDVDDVRSNDNRPVLSEQEILYRARDAIVSGKLKLVQSAWRDIRNREIMPSQRISSGLINVFGKYGDSKHALQVFEFLERRGWTFIIQKYNDVLDSFVSASDVHGAETFYQRIVDSGLALNTYTYNCMIHVHAKNKNVEAAEKYMNLLLESAEDPWAPSFNFLMYAFAANGDVANCRRWMNKMSEYGVSPNISSFRVLAMAVSKSAQPNPEVALELLSQMNSLNVKADVVFFNTVLDSYAKNADSSGAVECLSKMKSFGLRPDCYSWTTTMDAFNQANDVEEKNHFSVKKTYQNTRFSLKFPLKSI